MYCRKKEYLHRDDDNMWISNNNDDDDDEKNLRQSYISILKKLCLVRNGH